MSRVMDSARVAQASALQRKASNPARSVWVSADAGTGKTEVLTQRVLRLLLDDPTLRPDQLLALTFTKAGASEMALRLPNPRRAHDRTPWSRLSDADLRAELGALLERKITDADVARARELPRIMADHPPWVTTIHGFCQQVLTRFPHEADVPEGFDVLDDVAQVDLLRRASQRALEQANGTEAEALRWLLERMADSSLADLTDMLVRDWNRLRDVVGRTDILQARLRDKLGVGDVPPVGPAIGATELALLQHWASVVRQGGARDQDRAEKIDALTLHGTSAWQRHAVALKAIFLKQDGDKISASYLASKASQQTLGAAFDDVLQFQDRVHAHVCAERRYVTYRMTLDVLVWASCVARHYTAMKRARGALDFADLIAFTEQLLLKNTEGWRDWVMYRLDKNLRHLMVDETQDNSPTQGHLVELLARELLSGDVGEATPRTVFAVGDVKQSIYRFQGAAPELFLRLRDVLRDYPGAEVTGLSHSFRTSSTVLDVVNEVFSDAAGLVLRGDDETRINHQTVMPDAYGRVEIWPLIATDGTPDILPWTPAEHRSQRQAGPMKLAACMAEEIHRYVRNNVVLDSTGVACTYGDIMILTQRNAAAAQVVAGLRAAGIPAVMTGDDSELSPAVDDILVLLRALWNPADALALAQVLKSGLVGWDDARVLAWRLACKTVNPWDAVGNIDTAAHAFLVHWRTRLLRWMPYRWLVTFLREHAVATRYADLRGMDVILDTALREKHILGLLVRHEQGGIRSPNLTVSAGNRVRVMTVHQAKGLEAPIVFLADTTQAATARNAQREKLLFDMPVNGQLDGVLYWGKDGDGGDYQDALAAAERGRKLADSYRLLYVAMTRAKERLVVCGWQSRAASEDEDGTPLTWYAMVGHAREAFPTAWRAEGDNWVREQGTLPVGQLVTVAAPTAAVPPAWIHEVHPAVEDVSVAPVLGTDQQAALDYGTLVHRLLAILPPGDEAAVEAAAMAWVVRTVEPSLRDNVLAQAMAVWRALPDVFAAHSRAEVPLGLVDGSVGRIDRLVVRDDAIWIIDFKTERVVPEHVPASYAAQLHAYAAAVARAWSDRPIRCAIIWVNGVRVDWI